MLNISNVDQSNPIWQHFRLVLSTSIVQCIHCNQYLISPNIFLLFQHLCLSHSSLNLETIKKEIPDVKKEEPATNPESLMAPLANLSHQQSKPPSTAATQWDQVDRFPTLEKLNEAHIKPNIVITCSRADLRRYYKCRNCDFRLMSAKVGEDYILFKKGSHSCENGENGKISEAAAVNAPENVSPNENVFLSMGQPSITSNSISRNTTVPISSGNRYHGSLPKAMYTTLSFDAHLRENDWVFVESFDSIEALTQRRRVCGVVKRGPVSFPEPGITRHYYTCTRCPYKMISAEYNNKFTLFECGTHNHEVIPTRKRNNNIALDVVPEKTLAVSNQNISTTMTIPIPVNPINEAFIQQLNQNIAPVQQLPQTVAPQLQNLLNEADRGPVTVLKPSPLNAGQIYYLTQLAFEFQATFNVVNNMSSVFSFTKGTKSIVFSIGNSVTKLFEVEDETVQNCTSWPWTLWGFFFANLRVKLVEFFTN